VRGELHKPKTQEEQGGIAMNRFGSKKINLCILIGTLLAISVRFVPAHAAPAKPQDAQSIQQKMQKVIKFLDSPDYATAVSWEEHLVLVYQLAQGRMPSPLEFFLLGALRDQIGLTRSAALSVALRGKVSYPTWEQVRNFLNRNDASDFHARHEVRQKARKLAKVPRWLIMLEILKRRADGVMTDRSDKDSKVEPLLPNIQYNTYFGYLHAHSELSDGEGTPLEAYTYARDEGGLDFFGLTDHGLYMRLWPWENNWLRMIVAAQATYDPGNYATLWGFEWSNPVLGHINVLNTPDFTDTLSHLWIHKIYDWISERPEGFGRFDHPGGTYFLPLEFLHLAVYADAVPQMVGISTWCGTESFDTYYYSGSWFASLPFSYWDVGNLRGWYLGALGGQDNHSPHWGTRNDFRTAVLAEELTREHIVDAYLNRRFYSTEDKDLHLDVRCQGYPMGSRLTGVSPEFEVEAWDESGDTFVEVRLYRNGSLIQTKTVDSGSIQESMTDFFPVSPAYYYVILRQADDNDGNGRNDEAISSPIWIY
jgi:hypothetical protein